MLILTFPDRYFLLLRLAGLWLVCSSALLPVFSSTPKSSGESLQQYRITLEVDYRAASYKGRETVRLKNAAREPVDNLVFHLYPNVGLAEDAELWLTVQRISLGERELRFNYRPRNATIKISLAEKLQPGQFIELTIEFSGRVPKVQREESSLLAHFLQEVNDATSEERLLRDARDIFFASDQAVLLGYFYPMLATRASASNEQSLAAGVGGIVLSDVADYEVQINVSDEVTVIAPGAGELRTIEKNEDTKKNRQYLFRGERLRGVALAMGERLRSLEKRAGNTRIVSYFHEGDEKIGERLLNLAARALETYNKTFGEYPWPVLNVVELPLTAGYSGMDFPGLVALAQAYYIDFASPEAKRLPELVREQSDLIESALEFTLLHCIAHQWWGGVVGSDPQRNPWLDEALANYSAVYFYEAVYGRLTGVDAIEKHLRGTYHAWRMLGGADQEVDKPAKEFRSFMQYAAIAQAKSALMLAALRREMGDERFFSALRYYYTNQKFQIATPDHFRYAVMAAAADHEAVKDLFQHWLKEKHADKDIGVPEMTLFNSPESKKRALGRFFGRIGRAAARPF